MPDDPRRQPDATGTTRDLRYEVDITAADYAAMLPYFPDHGYRIQPATTVVIQDLDQLSSEGDR